MTSVEKQRDNGTITVQQEWLDRAKELTWKHGITSTTAMRALAVEMGDGEDTELAGIYTILAQRETAEERKGYVRAINDLQAAADAAHAPGPDHNLDRWAIYLAGLSYLQSRVVGS